MNKKILVIGASGTVGTELVRLLKAEGQEVISATSRRPERADQVQVNLATGQGLEEAFRGVQRAFLLSPPGFGDQRKILLPLIEAAKKHKLEKVVLMTAMGANAVETAPFRQAELALEKSGLAYNILRPNWFFQNFHTFWRQGIVEQGKILLPAGTAKVSFIDARDIAAVAAKLLLSDDKNNEAFDLTGPQSIDHAEVAQALSAATGKKIIYEEISPEAMRSGLLGAGLPADYVEFMLMIFGFLREGYSERKTVSVREIIGREPRSVEAYARDFGSSWR